MPLKSKSKDLEGERNYIRVQLTLEGGSSAPAVRLTCKLIRYKYWDIRTACGDFNCKIIHPYTDGCL